MALKCSIEFSLCSIKFCQIHMVLHTITVIRRQFEAFNPQTSSLSSCFGFITIEDVIKLLNVSSTIHYLSQMCIKLGKQSTNICLLQLLCHITSQPHTYTALEKVIRTSEKASNIGASRLEKNMQARISRIKMFKMEHFQTKSKLKLLHHHTKKHRTI